MIDLTPIANAVIALAALLITTFLIPWIRAKVSAERLVEIQKWVRIAVEAAEMVYAGSGLGEQKREYVVGFLASKGYTLDTASVEMMIESAVKEMKLMEPNVIAVVPGDDMTDESEENTGDPDTGEPEAEDEEDLE